ncbi:hypothetical protein HYS97_02830 [Candidatus Daviesbacteria bacterium]|nr:hypothetical protein [Candidatus Daviesbacteria bacterium]
MGISILGMIFNGMRLIGETSIPIKQTGLTLDRLGSLIPHPALREAYFVLLGAAGKPTRSTEVERHYLALEQDLGVKPNQETIDAIRFHRGYCERTLGFGDIARILWYVDPNDPRHISRVLTNNGATPQLLLVAEKFISLKPEDLVINSWKYSSVMAILDELRQGKSMPAVILSRRPKGMRPDGNMHIIDGVHRLLASSVHYLESGRLSPQEAFIA